VIELSARDALALRLAGQKLDRPAPRGTLVATAGAVGGVQAQVASAGRLSLALRVSGATEKAVERAVLHDRTLAKIWTVRGTLHFVPSEDVALHCAAFGPHRLRYNDGWLARMGLSREQMAVATEDVVEALADGPLTRRGIADRVADRHGEEVRRWIQHSWGALLRRVVYDGRVVFGPTQGTEVTFVRAEQWLAAGPGGARKKTPHAWTREDAEAEVVRRYLVAYGPATVRDFAFWAGVYVPVARAMWGRVEEEMVEVRVEGAKAPAYLHRSVAAKLRARRGAERAGASGAAARGLGAGDEPHVLLLPHFDTYLLGHRDKAAVVDARHYKRVFKTAGWIAPVLLVDGRVAGTWSGTRKKDRFVVALQPFGRLAKGIRPAAAERAREWGERLGLAGRLAPAR
jgi:hypothetical protein